MNWKAALKATAVIAAGLFIFGVWSSVAVAAGAFGTVLGIMIILGPYVLGLGAFAWLEFYDEFSRGD